MIQCRPGAQMRSTKMKNNREYERFHENNVQKGAISDISSYSERSENFRSRLSSATEWQKRADSTEKTEHLLYPPQKRFRSISYRLSKSFHY